MIMEVTMAMTVEDAETMVFIIGIIPNEWEKVLKGTFLSRDIH